MKIREFEFPTFDEWNQKNSWHQRIGKHYVDIYETRNCSNGKVFILRLSYIYTEPPSSPYQSVLIDKWDTLFEGRLDCDENTTVEDIKAWYKKNITKVKRTWRRTMKPYFVE